MDNEKYEKICRIAPLVQASEDLTTALSSCFSHFYRRGEVVGDIQVTNGRSRAIYTNLGSLADPLTDETLHIGLKLGENSPLEYHLMTLGNRQVSLRLRTEIANFEAYSNSEETPGFWGAVLHHEIGVAGLLIEDLSAGGINKIIPRSDIGDFEGDFLDVICPDGTKRTVLSDAKRYDSGNPKEGDKYFAPPAAINLPLKK